MTDPVYPAEPLVSVMVPCYNASKTLPVALTSLVCQTYGRWECIVVDDGSTDHPERVVETISDPRIRVIRFEHNRGRGAARQRALDEARGELLAMLDADDWWFPEKLERQVRHLEAYPDLVLVSAGAAITRGPHRLTGVRGRGSEGTERQGPFHGVRPSPVLFPATVVRLEVARQAGFDPALKRAQDLDFLLQVLQGRRYGTLDFLGYAYAEDQSYRPANIYEGLYYTRTVFRKHRRLAPLESRVRVAVTWAKRYVYSAASAVGVLERLVARRSRSPTAQERQAFEQAWTTVRSRMEAYGWPALPAE